MIHSVLRTKIPEQFLELPKIPKCTYRKYRPTFFKAESLLESCDNVVVKGEPDYWDWTAEEIADWMANDLKHPEFREACLKNEIDGKSLVFLEADKIPRMNIKNFDVIKELIKEIRNCFKIDQDEFKRSISLPSRRPQTLYLLYKSRRTGPTAYFMTQSKFYRKINIIKEEPAVGPSYYALLNHWNRIPPFMPWCPHVMIGANRRVNPMTGTTQRQIYHPKDHPFLLKDLCTYQLPYSDTFTIQRGRIKSRRANTLSVSMARRSRRETFYSNRFSSVKYDTLSRRSHTPSRPTYSLSQHEISFLNRLNTKRLKKHSKLI